jgi:hypothetical protein
MIFGVQILAIVFLALMMYFTFVNYKRKNYGFQSLILWMSVWLGAIILVSVPKTIYGIMQTLEIQRTADFFTLVGFAFFTAIIFYIYTLVKKNSYKMERLVRELAIKDAELSEKKNQKKANKK